MSPQVLLVSTGAVRSLPRRPCYKLAARHLLDQPDLLPLSWISLLTKRLSGHLDDQAARLHG